MERDAWDGSSNVFADRSNGTPGCSLFDDLRSALHHDSLPTRGTERDAERGSTSVDPAPAMCERNVLVDRSFDRGLQDRTHGRHVHLLSGHEDSVGFSTGKVDATPSDDQHAIGCSRRRTSVREGVGLQNNLDWSRYDKTSDRASARANSRRKSSNAFNFLPEICRLESYSREVLSTYWHPSTSRGGSEARNRGLLRKVEKSGSIANASEVRQAGDRGKRGGFESFVKRMTRRITSSSSYFTQDSSAGPHGRWVHSNEPTQAGRKIEFYHPPASAHAQKEPSCFQGKQKKSQIYSQNYGFYRHLKPRECHLIEIYCYSSFITPRSRGGAKK